MQDTQITELSGRHYLISQLLAGGVEVATPLRDRGIDLIAFLDRTEQGEFFACPIQLKANEEARFGLYSKYEKIPNLLMVYAWNVSSEAPSLYALTYAEALALLESRGHTETSSWKDMKFYSMRVNDHWKDLLAPYRMDAKDWSKKILAICKASEVIEAQPA
jgi:hypothetical protein